MFRPPEGPYGRPVGECLQLRRSVIARLRLAGALESASVFLSLVGVVAVLDSLDGPGRSWGPWDVVWLIAFLGLGLAVRVAVWFEYLVTDGRSLRWGSLWWREEVPVARIVEIDIAPMRLFGSKYGTDVLRVHHENGRTRGIRASAWCGRTAREEWLRSATELWNRTEHLR